MILEACFLGLHLCLLRGVIDAPLLGQHLIGILLAALVEVVHAGRPEWFIGPERKKNCNVEATTPTTIVVNCSSAGFGWRADPIEVNRWSEDAVGFGARTWPNSIMEQWKVALRG